MKKLIALFLVITFMVMNCAIYKRGEGINLEPGQKPGVKLVIQKTDGWQVKGELIAVEENSLLLMESESGADVSIYIADIWSIRIVKKSKAWQGLGIGALLGIMYGAATRKEGGGGFVASGLGIGALIGTDKTIKIEGKSDTEIKEALEKLRSKARIPNYQ